MDKKSINESIIVGVDFTNEEGTGCLIVGRQTEGKMTVINAFQGDEAWELYCKLVMPKGKGPILK